MNKRNSTKIIDLYTRAFGRPAYEARWQLGPTHELPPSFRVLVFRPDRSLESWVYATCGMAAHPGDAAVELHLFSPCEFAGHIELLTVIAHFHLTGHPLTAAGTTVNFGRPWMPDSDLTHGMLSTPHAADPCLLDAEGTRPVRFFWLLPITVQERDYKAHHGLEQLEDLFEAQGLRFTDPLRASMVNDSSPG